MRRPAIPLVLATAFALAPGLDLGAQGASPVAAACPRATDGTPHGTLVARVIDAATGEAVHDAVLTVYWRVTTVVGKQVHQGADERIARVDTAGRVRLCGLPAGAALLAWAEVAEARSVPTELTLPERDSLLFEFRVAAGELRATAAAAARTEGAAGARTNARVSGVVRATGGGAITGARVRFALGGPEVRTDAEGRFALPVVGPGARQLDVIALGWAPARRWVSYDADRTTHVDVTLDKRVQLLEEVKVVERSGFVRDFEARRRRGGGGHFMDRETIAADRTGSVMTLALAFPALRVNHDPNGRRLETLRRGNGCPIAVFLDGSPIDQVQLDALVTPDVLYGIEWYPGFASPPIQFTAFQRSSCGTMLLWTRDFVAGTEPEDS